MTAPHRTTNHELLLKMNLIITILGSLLILASLAIYLAGTYQAAMQKERENLQVLTMTAASKTQTLFNSLLITMKYLDTRIQDNPDKDPRFDPMFNRLVDMYRESTGRRVDLRMVAGDGGLFYLPSKSAKPLADVSKREFFTVQRDKPTEGLYFAEPVKSQVTGRWGIPVSYRLKDNKFGILVLFAVIEFHDLDDVFAEINAIPDRAVALIREDRLILERSPYSELVIGQRVPEATFTPDETGKGSAEIPTRTMQTRSVSYRKLENLPIYVMVGDSSTRLRHAWAIKAAIQAGIALFILIAFILLSLRQMRLLKQNIDIQNQLEKAARFDGLTGLRNRRYFFERFAEEIERSKRTKGPLVLLSIDIDFFKILNDTMGHPEGDRVLKLMAGLIDANIRTIDISGRIGGEEFAAILSDATQTEGKDIAERIRAAAEIIKIGNWTGGLSIGVAEWHGADETMEELYKRADDALYAAKNQGRNRVVASEA